MKNLLKITSILSLFLVFGCDSDDSSSRFSNDPNVGWIQFLAAESAQVSLDYTDDLVIAVPIQMAVPFNQSDLNISYTLESVSGLDPNSVYSSTNLIVPAGTGGVALVQGNPTIELDITLDAIQNITAPMIFDVVLQSTDRNEVQVGIEGTDRPTSNRVTICPSLSAEVGVALGDYEVSVPTGDGPFGVQFADGTVVTLVEGAGGPSSRVFQIDYLPNIGAGNPFVDIPFTFTADGVVINGLIASGLGCGAEILLGGSEDLAGLPCGDEVITLNLLDFIGGAGNCGQEDVETTIVLTKI